MIRLDREAPTWAWRIVEMLEDGHSGTEAVAAVAAGIDRDADDTEKRAIEAERKATLWRKAGALFICSETMERQYTRDAQEHRQWLGYLRTLAVEIRKLRGEVMMGLLR